jgi:NADH:ubiquinone oxidoreductase subunit 4 (subunit M)
VLMALAGAGVVLTTTYFVVMIRRVAQGTSSARWRGAVQLRDATPVELISWSPVVFFVVLLGFWPSLLLDATDPVVRRVLG